MAFALFAGDRIAVLLPSCGLPSGLATPRPTLRRVATSSPRWHGGYRSIPGRGLGPRGLLAAREACQHGSQDTSRFRKRCRNRGSRIESQFERCCFASTTTCWKLSSPAQHGPRVKARGPRLFRRVAQGFASLGRGAPGRASRDGGAALAEGTAVLLSRSLFSWDFVQLVPVLGSEMPQRVR